MAKKSDVGALVELIYNGDAIGIGQIEKTSNLAWLHGSRMSSGCFGVAVLEVYEGKDAPLSHVPSTNEDMTTLKKAEKSIVAWPKNDLRVTKTPRRESQEMTPSKYDSAHSLSIPVIAISTPPIVYTKKTKGAKRKDKMQEGQSSKMVSTMESSEEEIDDREMEAYMTEGANAEGKFPLNEDVTVWQDMLSKHLQNLKVQQETPLPWIPLCRLMRLEKARQVSWDANRLKPLADTFLLEGYYEPKGCFICSLDAPGYPTVDYDDNVLQTWDPLWQAINEEFESEIKDTCWSYLSGKMFYTWDGNHRLAAWMGVLQQSVAYQKDENLHPRVRVDLVTVDSSNEADMLSIVMQINKLNESGYIATSYTDMLWMVRAMGLASKETIMQKLPFVVYSWMQTEIDKRVGKKSWYNVPVALMSQLLHPEKYTLALRKIIAEKETMLPSEFQAAYKKAFFETDGPSRKMTKHALAMVDPALGDEWWRTLRTIEWTNKPKWITEERLYGLACADLPDNKKTYFLRAMSSNDIADIKSLNIPQTGESAIFREWLRIEVLWSTIAKEADNIHRSIRSVHLKSMPDLELETFFEDAKENHREKSFLYELGLMKKGPQAEANKALVNASKRCLCRWLRKRDFNIKGVKSLQTMLEVDKSEHIFTPMQIARNFKSKLYQDLPWFLEYAEGSFPPSEERQHNDVVKDREERASAGKHNESQQTPPMSTAAESSVQMAQPKDTATTSQLEQSEETKNLEKASRTNRKRDRVGLSAKEVADFAISLETDIFDVSDLPLVTYSSSDNNGGQIQIAQFNSDKTENDIKETLLNIVRPHILEKDLHPIRDGLPVDSAVNASIIFLPTNNAVYGISTSEVPDWNRMDVCQFGKLARLAHATADDKGIFIVVSQSDDYSMVRDLTAAAGWREDHLNVVVCKTPICKRENRTVRTMLISAMRKEQNYFAEHIELPEDDTWFDTLEEDDWTKDNEGKPLRGGVERGHGFVWQLLTLYKRA